MDELHGSSVRLHALISYDMVDQLVLAVPEAAYCFGLCRVVRAFLGELDTARGQKVANAIETGLPIHVEPIVRGEIEGAECFSSLPRTLLKIFVEHLFPTPRVNVGGVCYHAVEVKKDGIVLVAADALAIRLPHGSLSLLFQLLICPILTRPGRGEARSKSVPPVFRGSNQAHTGCR